MKIFNLIRAFLTLAVIVGPLPNTISNGQTIDAVPVMADFNWIMNQVNANAAPINSPTFTGTVVAAALNTSGNVSVGGTLGVTGITTPTGGIKGISTNTNAAAGNVDEYVESVVASGSVVSLTTGTGKTITSISLTPGDWDVSGSVGYTGNSTTLVTFLVGSIGTTNNGPSAENAQITIVSAAYSPFAIANPQFGLPTVRFSLAATTTIYLIGAAAFTVSTCNAFGTIRARRRQPGA